MLTNFVDCQVYMRFGGTQLLDKKTARTSRKLIGVFDSGAPKHRFLEERHR